MTDKPTIKQILSMSDEECWTMLGEIKKQIRESGKSFYHPSNRTSKGKPVSGQNEHYTLQGIRDWLQMKVTGQIELLKQIQASRLEV